MKRQPEELDALVVSALRPSPISAPALAGSLLEQGYPMTEAQAYRVLKRLVARGEARQIWLGRRYAVIGGAALPTLVLACSGCGGVSFAPASSLYVALRTMAAAQGFQTEEVILEAAGRCAACERTVSEMSVPTTWAISAPNDDR